LGWGLGSAADGSFGGVTTPVLAGIQVFPQLLQRFFPDLKIVLLLPHCGQIISNLLVP